MGNNTSRISDIFYPDNPNRRARASQLRDDVQGYIDEFNELKKSRDTIINEIGPRLSAFLKKHGYHSPDELDKEVQKVLKGDALANYVKIKAEYDKSDIVSSTIFGIASVISVSTGIFLGGLVAFAIISGGLALEAIGAIGTVLGVVAVIVILFEIFQGDRERANMQKAIRELYFERIKARMALQEMRAISDWIQSIKFWLDEPLISNNETLMKKKLEGDFQADFDKAKRIHVIEYLDNLDRERNAWTNEDPFWGRWGSPYSEHSQFPAAAIAKDAAGISPGADSVLSVETTGPSSAAPYTPLVPEETKLNDIYPAAKVNIDYIGQEDSGSLELTFLSNNRTSCNVLDSQGNEWIMDYESCVADENADNEKSSLADFRFALKNVTTGNVLNGCKLALLRNSVN